MYNHCTCVQPFPYQINANHPRKVYDHGAPNQESCLSSTRRQRVWRAAASRAAVCNSKCKSEISCTKMTCHHGMQSPTFRSLIFGQIFIPLCFGTAVYPGDREFFKNTHETCKTVRTRGSQLSCHSNHHRLLPPWQKDTIHMEALVGHAFVVSNMIMFG